MVYAFPSNEKLWTQYTDLRRDSLRNDGDGSIATEFYQKHRAEMDFGAQVAWPERFDPDELSAVQHAMNLKIRDESAFWSEYQNSPIIPSVGEEMLTAEEIAAKTNGYVKGVVPLDCHHLTMFIDIHQTLLYWLVVAWDRHFSGYIIDYGTFPDQKRPYFMMKDAHRTLQQKYKSGGLEGMIYAGPNMKIEIREISTIRPYEKNPRLNDKAVDPVAASLKEFGFRQPIVVDNDNVIVVGHTRYRAALKLGLTKVPVHVATDLSSEQVRAYRIADNKTAEIADWNLEILPIEISELKAAGFDMGTLAFSDKELTQLLNISASVSQGLTDPDSVPEPPDEAITRKGDIWILGNHRLMCGDSASRTDFDKLLDGNIINLVNTDPPYNVRPMYIA
ncbi:MAG: ParB N-terminal domain-containing protein [Planctomycetaceae bacterium]|nr:ParB N-terminal domain-containing protein [Planctomycetaceae bacterium]